MALRAQTDCVQEMSKEIAFVTLANPDVGFGHLNRCLLLAQAIFRAGAHIDVFLLPPYDGVDAFLKSFGWPYPVHKTKTFPKSLSADTCIVDLYRLEPEIGKIESLKCSTIVIFDDGKHIQIPSSINGVISLNTGLGRKYPSRCKVFSGLQYCLIRPEFFQNPWRSPGDYIVICMGGSDPENQTIRMAEICVECFPAKPILVVEGPGFRRQTDALWQNIPNLTVVTDPHHLAVLMSKSAFAISAGGTMLFELIALGVPVACLTLDDAQDRTALAVSEVERVQILGRFDKVNDEELGKGLQELGKRFLEQQLPRATPSGLFDGKGDVRLARDLLQWLETTTSME